MLLIYGSKGDKEEFNFSPVGYSQNVRLCKFKERSKMYIIPVENHSVLSHFHLWPEVIVCFLKAFMYQEEVSLCLLGSLADVKGAISSKPSQKHRPSSGELQREMRTNIR